MTIQWLLSFFLVLRIFLGAVFASETTVSNSSRNLRSGEPSKSTVEKQVFFSDTHRNTTLAVADQNPQDHRRTQQSRTILIVRIVNKGKGPTVNSNVIRQYVFSDRNSLKSQMRKCSANAIIFSPSAYGTGGVIDIPVKTDSTLNALVGAAQDQALQAVGVADLREAADHVMFILPQINEYLAEAEVGSGFSYEFGVALSVLMHEMGHNLGLDHAGVGTDEYADYSGNMGRSIVRRGGPLLCYNAANHWDLGWFTNGRRDLGNAGPKTPVQVTLTGFSSYPTGDTFLVKIGNIFMQYNHASAHNINTDAATSNQLVVVQKNTKGRTLRVAVLDQGGEYKSDFFVVKVCAKRGTSMDISIGRSSTNCGAAAVNPAPRRAPQPTTSSSWGNHWFAPGPTPTSATWWNPAPSPQLSRPTIQFSRPTIQFPSPTVIWLDSTPQLSRPTIPLPTPPFVRPSIGVFNPSPPSGGFDWPSSSWTLRIRRICILGC